VLAELLEKKAAWLPSRVVRIGAPSDFPAGSLLLYARNLTAGGDFELCLRVGEAGSVFCLTAMGGGMASVGDLIDLAGWRERMLGIDASEHGLPILELNPSAGFVPEPGHSDRRGGFVTIGMTGAHLRARAKSFVGGMGDEAPIDPLKWCEAPKAPPQDRPIWIGKWRLRIPVGGDDPLVFDCGVD